MEAVRGLTAREVPVLAALMAIRRLPALLRRRRPPVRGPLIDGMSKGGFVQLHEARGERVLGLVGGCWQPSSGVERGGAAGCAGFSEPGWAGAGVKVRG